MNNLFDDKSQHDSHSLLNDLMKPQNPDHQLHDISSLYDHHSAFGHDFEYHQHPLHTPNADNHSAGDLSYTPLHTPDLLQPDNLPLPDLGSHEQYQSHSYHFDEQMTGNVQTHQDHGHFHYHEHIACSSKSPEIYTTMSDDGTIYKHTPDAPNGYHVGFVHNLNVYSGYQYVGNKTYLGYGNNDGNIYDSHNNHAGWVDPDGHVYNASGVEVYQTTRGVAGAAAYLLCAYQGGVA